MSRPGRWTGWRVDALLWAAALVGLAGAVTVLLAERLPIADVVSSDLDVRAYAGPSALQWVELAVLLGMPLLLAVVTHRTSGYVTGASLMLGVACAGMWVRGQFRWDSVSAMERPQTDQAREATNATFDWGRGGVLVKVERERFREPYERRSGAAASVGVEGWTWCAMPDPLSGYRLAYSPTRPPIGFWNQRGFDLALRPEWGTYGGAQDLLVTVAAPYWFLCGLCLPAPLLWSWREVRRRRAAGRQRTGRCVHCGYDLRATPARCPECGMAAKRATSSAP